MIPHIHSEENDDDADFLIVLLVHCLKVVNHQKGRVREYIADIILKEWARL